MAKSVFEETGGTYHEENRYFIPGLTLTTEEEKPIGMWGQRRLRYIKGYKRLFYGNLLISGNANGYLMDIDERYEEPCSSLVQRSC